MAKDKFAPAPWHIEVSDEQLRIVDADDCEICYEEEHDTEYQDEQTATFALMAASPRLLHALEALVGEAALELGETYPPVVAAREAIKLAREGV